MSFKFIVIIALALGANVWSQELSGDFNCDGKPEKAWLEENEIEARIIVKHKPKNDTVYFEKKEETIKDAFCEKLATLEVEALSLDKDVMVQMFGEELEGYRKSPKCKGLALKNQCGTKKIHIYWDGKNKKYQVLRW